MNKLTNCFKNFFTVNKKILEIISNKDNYNDKSWQEIEKDQAKVGSLDKAIFILKKIKPALWR